MTSWFRRGLFRVHFRQSQRRIIASSFRPTIIPLIAALWTNHQQSLYIVLSTITYSFLTQHHVYPKLARRRRGWTRHQRGSHQTCVPSLRIRLPFPAPNSLYPICSLLHSQYALGFDPLPLLCPSCPLCFLSRCPPSRHTTFPPPSLPPLFPGPPLTSLPRSLQSRLRLRTRLRRGKLPRFRRQRPVL